MEAPAEGAAVVELTGIRKTFPGVVANDDVNLTIRRGEVHCLLGENGAGKSTLMNILAGMYRPDAGRILVDGRDVEPDSPKRSLELGIGMVYQHSTLIPTLTVLENLMLGSSDLLLDVKGSRARFAELAGMLGVEVDPDAEAGSLALGRQQQVEIMKALWRGSRVLILDEPTSMLTPQGVAELGRLHHAQAVRGDRAGRPGLGLEAGPTRRRGRPRDDPLARPGGAPGADRPAHVRGRVDGRRRRRRAA
jgi:general nucleoside transport system ATP-binding protein